MKIPFPEHLKPVHESIVPVRWGDMDAMGHVNNTLYFRYLEIARMEWLGGLGMDGRPSGNRAAGEGVLVMNAFCTFHRQLKYPADVLVRSFCGQAGRSSFEHWATMERTDELGIIYASGGATMVWANLKEGVSTPMPDWLRAALE